MSASEETALMEKHEEILGRRALLLEQMERRGEQQKVQRKRRLKEREAARVRNHTLLQEFQTMEDGLRGRRLPHPTLQALETRYWASVEQSIPVWELFLLGKGPHPADGPGQAARTAKQTPSKDQGLPPRPKPGPVRR